MKAFIGCIVFGAFLCIGSALFAAPADGVYKAKYEQVKAPCVMVAEVSAIAYEVPAPVVLPLNHITGVIACKAITKKKEAVANGPPHMIIERNKLPGNRIRARTD